MSADSARLVADEITVSRNGTGLFFLMLSVIPSLLVVVFAILCVGAHPHGDDFAIGSEWRASGGLKLIRDMYFGWSGRIPAFLLIPIPFLLSDQIGFGIGGVYQALCLSTVVLIVVFSFWLIRRFLDGEAKSQQVFMGSLFAAALIAGSPSPEDMVFWFTAVACYTLPGLATLVAAAWLHVKAWRGDEISVFSAVCLASIATFVALSSEFGGIGLILLTMSAFLQRCLLSSFNRHYAFHCCLVAMMAVAVIVVLIAPGNSLRLGALGTRGFLPVIAIQQLPGALLDFVVFLFRRITNPTFVALAAALFLVPLKLSPIGRLTSSRFFLAVPVIAGGIAIFVGLWMGRIATGQMLEHRAQNQLHYILTFLLILAVILARNLGLMAPLARSETHWLSRRGFLIGVTACLFATPKFIVGLFCLAHLGQITSQINDRAAILDSRCVHDLSVRYGEVIVPGLAHSNSFFSESLTEDPNHWINRSVARYICVGSVRLLTASPP